MPLLRAEGEEQEPGQGLLGCDSRWLRAESRSSGPPALAR